MQLSKNRLSELALLSQKKHRRQQGICVLEGERLISQLLEYDIYPRELYHLPDHPIPEALCQTPLYDVTERDLNRICDTEHPQGIAGLYELPRHEFRGFRRAFYLDGISDPGNLGTIFRTALAFDWDTIFLSEDCADPASPKVIRASLGAVYRLPFAYMNPVALRLPGLQVLGTATDGELILNEFHPPLRQPLLVVVGSEAHGISEPIVRRCNAMLRIPMSAGMESLNAAIAAGIIAQHIYVSDLKADSI